MCLTIHELLRVRQVLRAHPKCQLCGAVIAVTSEQRSLSVTCVMSVSAD